MAPSLEGRFDEGHIERVTELVEQELLTRNRDAFFLAAGRVQK